MSNPAGKTLRVARTEAGYRVGETHHRAKLTDADVDTILALREYGLSYREIAEKFDDGLEISKSTVRDICSGRIRGRAPYTYAKVV